MKKPNATLGREASKSDTNHVRPSFQWRALTPVVVMLSFLLLMVSGVGLWVAPPGRIALWTDWMILGLRKGEWANLHLWFGVLFVMASGVHLAQRLRSRGQIACRSLRRDAGTATMSFNQRRP